MTSLSRMTSRALVGGTTFFFLLGASGCIGGTQDDEPKGGCGNGTIEAGEQCDDGNRVDHDGCSSECLVESSCGNGAVEVDEECDDGNFTAGDGCDERCGVERGCGNGRLEVGEECDDDNLYDGDGCDAYCIDETPGLVCGNGIFELEEWCDDGNNVDGDGCSADCHREDGCGDGTIDASELCDDGNTVDGDGCSGDCLVEFVCGNDICELESYETCERCPWDCCPSCGDGVLDEGEACDDGNNQGDDGCSRGCADEDAVATCGNGIWEAGEECEDGNTTVRDGCSDSCLVEFVCGDMVCESDTGETCQRCASDCCPTCGNGVLEVNENEACDRLELGGLGCQDFCYTGGVLSCTDWCTVDLGQCTGTGPVCGDGVAECAEACDGADLRYQSCADRGYREGTLACAGCQVDVSGCSNLGWYLVDGFEDPAAVASTWLLTGDWEVGVPFGVAEEPPAASEGIRLLGTSLGGDYSHNQTFFGNLAISPPIDLTGAVAPILRFWLWGATSSTGDGMNVWVSTNDGSTWGLLTAPSVAYNDTEGGQQVWSGTTAFKKWQEVRFGLTGYVGQTVRIAFSLLSNASTAYSGMYVDRVLVTEPDLVPVELQPPDSPLRVGAGFGTSYPVSVMGGSGTYQFSILGGTNHSWLSIDPALGTLSGTPLQSNLGPASVIVRAADATTAINDDVATIAFDVFEAVYFQSFEGGSPAGWTFACDFQWGTPIVPPNGCHEGTRCVGTNMSGDHSNSANFNTCVMDSAPIDLTSTVNPFLSFYMWIYTNADFDGGNVKVSANGGSTWTLLVPQGGYDGVISPASPPDEEGFSGNKSALGWHEKIFDLAAWAGQTVKLRWAFGSTSSGTNDGWYIDSVTIAD